MTFLSMCLTNNEECFKQGKDSVYWQYHPGIFNQEGLKSSAEQYNTWVESTLVQLEKIRTGDYTNLEYKIPPITHVVYLSHESNVKIGAFEERKIIESSAKYSEEEPFFKHFFWTNNPDLVTDAMLDIPNFQIRDIHEFSDHKLWNNFVHFMHLSQTHRGHLAQASDLARLMIVKQYGGIYRDADYSVFKDVKIILNSMKLFTYINGKEFEWENSFVGNAFMACVPDDLIVTSQIELIYRNLNHDRDTLPQYVQNPATLVDDVLFKTGPVAITVGIEQVLQANTSYLDNIIIFPHNVIYNYNMARAYSQEKYYSDFSGNFTECEAFHDIYLCSAGGDPFGGSWTKNLTAEATGVSDHLSDNFNIYY